MLKKITILEALNKCMTTIKEYIGLVADKKVDKVEGKCLTTNDLTDQLVENYNTAYNHSQEPHAPSNAQKNSDITKAEIEAKLTGQIDTHFHDLSEDLSEYDRRLDVSENKIENINQEITNTIKPTLNTHETKLNNIEAINVEQNNRLENIEVKNQEQDNRINTLETNDKIQDLNIKALFTTSDIMDIEEEGNSLSLHNSKRGFAIIDEIKGNTLVNCNKEPDKELILNGNINDSGDNTVTLTEGVDGGLVDVYLEGNTLVNVSKTKDDYITPSIEDKVDKGSVISLPEASEGYISINSIEGNTLVNYCTDGSKELILNGDIDVEGTSVTTTEGVDNGLVDVMCEGNTLVNLVQGFKSKSDAWITVNDKVTFENPNRAGNVAFKIMLKPSTKYTVITRILENSLAFVAWDLFPDEFEEFPPINDKTGLVTYTFTTPSDITSLESFRYYYPVAQTGKVVFEMPMILEGDWTDKEIPEYFEGMKSVGQDDENGHKIEIVSQSKNLLPLSPVSTDSEGYGDKQYSDWDNVKLKPNTKYTLSYTGKAINYTNNVMWGIWIREQKTNKTIPGEHIISSAMTDISLSFTTTNEEYYKLTLAPNNGDTTGSYLFKPDTVILEEGERTSYVPYAENKKEILLNEPLRGLPNGVKDRFVKIGGKWFIERNCGTRTYEEGDKDVYITDLVNTVYPLETPIYEPLEIEPTLNTYNEVTHISNNSIIPCNMQIKNTGYNAIIKPSTLYTVALDTDKNGTIGINLAGAKVTTTNNVATITTPETLSDDSLRLYGKGIKGSKVRLLEGDKTNWIPSFFEGMKSSFEDKVQEDGTYKMEILSNNKNLFDIDAEYYKAGWGNQNYQRNGNGFSFDAMDGWNSIGYEVKGRRDKTVVVSATVTCVNKDTSKLREQSFRVHTRTWGGANETPFLDGETKRIKFNVKLNHEGSVYFNGSSTPEGSNNGGVKWTVKDILIEDVDGGTGYFPRECNKIQLSSIEPLRGVGNVHDRLVFKDGKLMIERNCKQSTLDNNTSGIDIYSFEYTNTVRVSFRGVRPEMKFYQLVKCDKFSSKPYNSNVEIESVSVGGSNDLHFYINKGRLPSLTVEGVKQWLQSNPLTVVYELAEPTYEEIPYDLQKIIMESYENGTLFFDTNIPPTKVSFNCFEEELTYLYPATSYTVQFVSDKATTADITLGGTSLLAQNIVKGLNRITITTPSELIDNKLIIDGAGAKISEVVVTDTDREFKYFEGMKSVGECEGNKIEILSRNKNLWDINDFDITSGIYSGVEITRLDNGFKFNGVSTESFTRHCIINYLDKFELGKTYILTGNYFVFENTYADGHQTWLDRVTVTKDLVKVSCYFQWLQPSTVFDNLIVTPQIEEGTVKTTYVKSNYNKKEIPLNEPLRSIGDIKDRYVLIDGKWYIERNCGEFILTDSLNYKLLNPTTTTGALYIQCHFNIGANVDYTTKDNIICNRITTTNVYSNNTNIGVCYVSSGDIRFRLTDSDTVDSFKTWLNQGLTVIVYKLASPIYEPLEYNPLEVYSEVTHISTNSTIPTKVTVKNHGYNCILKPSTTYTISSNLGLNTVTTGADIGDSYLRFMDTDTSDVTTMRDVLVLEGDWSSKSDLIPGFFAGIKSVFEQELVTDENDVNYGKYKVNVKVTNEDETQENNITFYINEPLRGVGDIKDKVYVKDDKVVVQRNCGIRAYADGDFDTYITDKVNTVYPLETPTYEEIDYINNKLYMEIFKNSTLFYNGNIPVTSKVHYTYSVPLVDKVSQTANISDEQDQLIIDMAVQVSVLEIMTL